MSREEVVQNALNIIKGLTGVRAAFVLDEEIKKQMLAEESTVQGAGGYTVENEGVKEAMKRDVVIALIKDPRFRPPPEPTIIMTTNGKIVGQEIFPWTAHEVEGQNVIWLSDGFCIFVDRIENAPSKFVMPPVSFPELNPGNGCKDVVSCSPAPTTDLMMRKHEGLEDNGKLASVVVGFNFVDDA